MNREEALSILYRKVQGNEDAVKALETIGQQETVWRSPSNRQLLRALRKVVEENASTSTEAIKSMVNDYVRIRIDSHIDKFLIQRIVKSEVQRLLKSSEMALKYRAAIKEAAVEEFNKSFSVNVTYNGQG